jgi:hypothetical protein
MLYNKPVKLGEKMGALETMKEELRLIQNAMRAMLTESGHVIAAEINDYQCLVQEEKKYLDAIKTWEKLFCGHQGGLVTDPALFPHIIH